MKIENYVKYSLIFIQAISFLALFEGKIDLSYIVHDIVDAYIRIRNIIWSPISLIFNINSLEKNIFTISAILIPIFYFNGNSESKISAIALLGSYAYSILFIIAIFFITNLILFASQIGIVDYISILILKMNNILGENSVFFKIVKYTSNLFFGLIFIIFAVPYCIAFILSFLGSIYWFVDLLCPNFCILLNKIILNINLEKQFKKYFLFFNLSFGCMILEKFPSTVFKKYTFDEFNSCYSFRDKLMGMKDLFNYYKPLKDVIIVLSAIILLDKIFK